MAVGTQQFSSIEGKVPEENSKPKTEERGPHCRKPTTHDSAISSGISNLEALPPPGPEEAGPLRSDHFARGFYKPPSKIKITPTLMCEFASDNLEVLEQDEREFMSMMNIDVGFGRPDWSRFL